MVIFIVKIYLMGFTTKLNLSNNRQVTQDIKTITHLSGATVFGVPFSYLPKGPDLTTSATTQSFSSFPSTFSGNSSTTNFTWYYPAMSLGNSYISAITPSNSATTQYIGPIFTTATTSTIDGNVVALTYSGVQYNITVTGITSLGGGNYSGTVNTTVLYYLSAGTLDFTGRTIWVDVSGITRTDSLIVSNVGAGPATTDIGVDSNGKVVATASDESIKEKISKIDSPLDKILNLNGVYFEWIDKDSGGNERKIGFIAQEVEQIVPELVFKLNNGLKGVHYKEVTALLVEAVKELYSGKTTNSVIETQTIIAEDNNIELNYGGTKLSAINGGLKILHALGKNKNAEFLINDDGNWKTNNTIIVKGIEIPYYTPNSSNDLNYNVGNLTIDDSYLYVKTQNKWGRIKLENF